MLTIIQLQQEQHRQQSIGHPNTGISDLPQLFKAFERLETHLLVNTIDPGSTVLSRKAKALPQAARDLKNTS